MAKQKLWIDCVAGSQLRDTQGEMLSVEGADIAELQAGRGRWNDNHGKGFFNSIGRITEAKKIFSEEDCENDRQKYYWEKVKAPYVYARGYLYSDEDHPNARAAAAILRNIHKSDSPLKLKASVEGGVISRGIKDPSLLAQTKIHSVALTFTPANNATLVEPLELNKGATNEVEDKLLIKSVLHLAQDWNSIPSFRTIERKASAEKIQQNVAKISKLVKAISNKEPNIKMPTVQELVSSAVESKIQRNVETINKLVKHLVVSEQEEFEKGFKNALAGAALAGSVAMTPSTSLSQDKTDLKQPQNPITHESVVGSLKDKNPVLWAISNAESSGGKNLKHSTMDRGMHTGHTAGGPWGLMPNTVSYILGTSKKLQNKYPDLAERHSDVDKNHEYLTNAMNANPQAAHDFATALYNRLHKIHGGDPQKIIHSWHHGVGGTHKATKKNKKHQESEYNQRVNKYLDQVPVSKALTAGYGGAGKPTGRTNGAVIQSESLDDGRSGFKYISCDRCGKEQVYSSYQVKCRDCGCSFSLEKLLGCIE